VLKSKFRIIFFVLPDFLKWKKCKKGESDPILLHFEIPPLFLNTEKNFFSRRGAENAEKESLKFFKPLMFHKNQEQ